MCFRQMNSQFAVFTFYICLRSNSILIQAVISNEAMTTKEDEQVEVNFESHPPIEGDLDGISSLLRQTLLHYADCTALARHLIELKDVTQVIALEEPEEENSGDEDEPDDNIYGVASVIDLNLNKSGDDLQTEPRKQLIKFLKDKCPKLKELLESGNVVKPALIVNERYINLPARLALPFMKRHTEYLKENHYTHLIFVSKILLSSRNTDTKLPSKKPKSGGESSKSKGIQTSEPIVYVNPEEEIVFENSDLHSDLDVSAHCDENATWTVRGDIKYIPHRRIMLMDHKKWSTMLTSLEKELSN